MGLRQEDVAARAGKSREQIVRLEAGRSAPSLGTARALAEALNCSVEEIFPG
jgi:DNA-binding XRE family transcriptional regulator